MPDVITSDERKAINAAIRRGKCQRIPQGQSAYVMIWNPDTKRIDDAGTQINWRAKRDTTWAGRDAARAEGRRARLMALYRQGMTIDDVAKALDVSRITVKKYATRLRKEGHTITWPRTP